MRLTFLFPFAIFIALTTYVCADIFGTGDNQFTIDFVLISGDASSANGTNISDSSSYKHRRSFVDPDHDFRMGIYEITNGQWDKFTNIFGNPTGSPSSGYDGSSYYLGANLPFTGISWFQAAQFVNWLNTSTGHTPAYKFTGTQGTSDYAFEPWDVADKGYDDNNPFRNINAYYFLPTEHEWVKAAYWCGSSLQTFATPDDSVPESGVDSNYSNQVDWGKPWDVGSGSKELNGTFDMMGNVAEWMEDPYYKEEFLPYSERVVRGGFFSRGTMNGYPPAITSSHRSSYYPYTQPGRHGFRVASTPEPATLLLFVLGLLFLNRIPRMKTI